MVTLQQSNIAIAWNIHLYDVVQISLAFPSYSVQILLDFQGRALPRLMADRIFTGSEERIPSVSSARNASDVKHKTKPEEGHFACFDQLNGVQSPQAIQAYFQVKTNRGAEVMASS